MTAVKFSSLKEGDKFYLQSFNEPFTDVVLTKKGKYGVTGEYKMHLNGVELVYPLSRSPT